MTTHYSERMRTYGQAKNVPEPFCQPNNPAGYRLNTTTDVTKVNCAKCLKGVAK